MANQPTTEVAQVSQHELLSKQISDIVEFGEPEQKEIAAIKETIDINNTVSVIKYGEESQKEITEFSDRILNQIKIGESGEIGSSFQEMITTMKTSHLEQVKPDGFLKRLPIIGQFIKSSIEEFITRSKSVTARIEDSVRILRSVDTRLTHEVEVLDDMYDENLKLIRHMELFIAAGEAYLEEVKAGELATLRAKAEETNDQMDVQKYKDMQQAVDRFEKRVHNLKLGRISAIQAVPQIRIIQECHRMGIEDIQDIIHNNIPMWKRQFITAISIYEGQQALQVTKGVKDYTNAQYKKQAEAIQDLSSSVIENCQRGVLDIDSIVHVNNLTIETIEHAISAQKEGRNKRIAAEEQIRIAESQLKEALMKAIDEE